MKNKTEEPFSPVHLLVAGAIGTALGVVAGLAVRSFIPHLLDVSPHSDGTTVLSRTDGTGQNPQKLGYVVSCPQSCAVTRPGSSTHKSPTYPTPGSVREVVFTSDGTSETHQSVYNSIRTWLGKARTSNDFGVAGCAHVAKQVPVTKVVSDGAGGWTEQVYCYGGADQFYSIVPSGKQSVFQYVADEIWISSQEWQPNGSTKMQDIYKDIPNRPTPILDMCS